MNRLMNAIEGMSDEHIKEFAFVQMPKRTIPLWIKIGSSAASLVLIALTITLIASKTTPYIPVTSSDSGSEYNSSGSSYTQTNSSEYRSESDSSGSSDVPTKILPLVIFNDVCYVIAGHDYPTYDLPEGYVFVGEVTSNDKADRNANGYSSGCRVGDKIYQNPADPQDVFVNTELFSGGAGYWYIRFVKSRTSHDVIPSGADTVSKSAVTADEFAPPVETEADRLRWNVPSEGDEIHDKYFVHTYSNGQKACVPFDSEIERNYSNIPTRPIDVAALKKLGADEPLTDEICYEVVEFLDGTKRYFKLGEAPLAFTDPLRYGIYCYVEGGSGEYYTEVLPDGMTISGWR